MSKKSSYKKFRYSSGKKANVMKAPVTEQTAGVGGMPAGSNSPSTAVKAAGTSGRQAGAQYAPDQFKYVGMELKVAGAIAGIILVIIIVLYFILH
ncbi:MAG: hypothetical protein JW856_03185 [Dehalococcoidales bacterium]|nr:hypothetical protein [Dehalococcoidales bacterium]